MRDQTDDELLDALVDEEYQRRISRGTIDRVKHAGIPILSRENVREYPKQNLKRQFIAEGIFPARRS
jgi:hypothetical protein